HTVRLVLSSVPFAAHPRARHPLPTRRSSDLRRARICITRRISSSRPMTGSSFCRRASSVRSRAYFSSDAYVEKYARDLTELARRSEEHTSELQSPDHLVCRLLLENKKRQYHA